MGNWNLSPPNKWSYGPLLIAGTSQGAHFVATVFKHTSTYSPHFNSHQGTVPLLSGVAKRPGTASIEPKRHSSSLLQYALAKSCQTEKVVINNCGDIIVIFCFYWRLSKKGLLFWTNSKNVDLEWEALENAIWGPLDRHLVGSGCRTLGCCVSRLPPTAQRNIICILMYI